MSVKLCLIPVTDNSSMGPQCNLEYKYLFMTFHDYKDLLWTTFAEFPGDVAPHAFFPLKCCFLVNQPKCKHCYTSHIQLIENCVIYVLMLEYVF